MKASNLREKSADDLRELQKSLASDVFQNRLKNFTNRLDDTSAIRKSKRDLARVITLLHERELKHGSRTTSGAIECALMTSNRYLAEIIESSRETLLAFIDRIAFINFVPKGFADPAHLGLVLTLHPGAVDPQPSVRHALDVLPLPPGRQRTRIERDRSLRH